MSDFQKTARNEVRRISKRGKYDRESIYEILDEGFLCQVGFNVEQQPFVIPTLYARDEDSILIHGSSISRMLKNLSHGIEVCVSVTLVDGLVLARSAFHHSMNYRSVNVYGNGILIEDRDEKILALKAIAENVIPGRWEDSRKPNEKELSVTSVIRIIIDDASAKVREGDPIDDEIDYRLPIWAGVVPIETKFGVPIADSKLDSEIQLPSYLVKS